MAQALPFHFPVILGWDVAGVVEEVGPAVTWFKPGDQRLRLHPPPPPRSTAPTPSTRPRRRASSRTCRAELSFEEAAALPLAALTAHQALEALGLRGGETLFLGGGAGGVGHVAIQLAVARGARVVATASERNHDFLRELGAEPLDYAAEDLPRARARPAGRLGRRRRVRPVRRRPARAGVRLAAPRRPAGLDRPPAAGAAQRPPRGPLHLRAPERLRPRRAHHAAGRTRAACARTSGDVPARAGGRRARAHRGKATCAASSSSRSTDALADLVGEHAPVLGRRVGGGVLVGPVGVDRRPSRRARPRRRAAARR